MSQWHVLSGDPDGNTYQIAYHIPVPSANNRVGVNYQVALVNSGLGGRSIMATGTGPGQITSAELAQVQSGALYEFVETYFTNPGNNIATDTANLNARFTALSAANGPALGPLQKQLTNYGGTSAS